MDAGHVMRLQDAGRPDLADPLLLSPWRPRAFQAQLDGVLRDPAQALRGHRQRVGRAGRRGLLQAAIARLHPRARCPTWTCGSSRWSATRAGVAFSFNKHVALPEGAALRNEMPRSTTRKVSRRWVTVNALIGGLAPVGGAADPGALRGPRRPSRSASWSKVLRADRSARCPMVRSTTSPTRASRSRGPTSSPAAGSGSPAAGCRFGSTSSGDVTCPAGPRRLVELMTAPVRRRYGYR